MTTAPRPEKPDRLYPLQPGAGGGVDRAVDDAARTAGAPADSGRLYALDVFRGGAIAGVILVNTVATFPASYPHLDHSDWEGLTIADVGFPFFLFIVGIAADFTINRRRAAGVTDSQLIRRALIRAIILFGLGFLGNLASTFDLTTVRIPGVLQRIGITYFLATLIALRTGAQGRLVTAAFLLLGYWLLMTLVPVPGTGVLGMHTLDQPDATLAAWVDRTVLGAHLWSQTVTWDPEGLLSTIPAVATTVTGTLAAWWIRQHRPISERAAALMAVGVIATVGGAAWSFAFPIIKGIWTSSYALVTTGLAALILGACLWVIDIRRIRWWTAPFVPFGVNPLAIYIGSSLVNDVLRLIHVGPEGARIALRTAAYQELMALGLNPNAASFVYGLIYVSIWFAVAWWLYRRGVRIRV